MRNGELKVVQFFSIGSLFFLFLTVLCGCQQNATPQEKNIITIATDVETEISEAVLLFNETHDECQIRIKSYLPEDIDRLNAEMSSGDFPDMFCFGSNFFFGRSAFQPEIYEAKGMLADVYSFIDGDQELSRESFLPNVLKAVESDDGALYMIPAAFWIDVVVGDSAVVGEKIGWTFAEMQEVLVANPKVKCAFGPYMTQDYLLGFLLSYNYDVFVDWENGTNRFDTDEFRDVLSFVKSHYEEIPAAEERSEYDLIQDGEQILMYGKQGRIDSIQKYYQYFATEDITFVGFPTASGAGNAFNFDLSFAISSHTEYGELCWEFIRDFLMDDYDKFPFPVNKVAFQNRLNNVGEYEEPGASITIGTGDSSFKVTYVEATEEQIEKIAELVSSLDRATTYDSAMFEIVWEEAQTYFAGDKSLEAVSEQISARVSIYMAEQG